MAGFETIQVLRSVLLQCRRPSHRAGRLTRTSLPGIAFIALLFLTLTRGASAVPPPSLAPTKAPTVHNYAMYLKKPSSLGFAPDQTYFESMLVRLEQDHVDHPTTKELYIGVVKEVSALLKDAKISSVKLHALAINQSLPTDIINLYGDRIDPHLLWYAMINGLFLGTGDRFTNFWTPAEYKALNQVMHQSLAGTGMLLGVEHTTLVVVEVFDGAPAEKAGIRAGDEIVEINGKTTKGMNPELAASLIRGKPGTSVTLTLYRKGGAAKGFSVHVVRARIVVPSVSHRMLPDHIGYMRLRIFASHTVTEVRKALDDLQKHGARALVIDLRYNPGGYMMDALGICSMFARPGSKVLVTVDSSGVHHIVRTTNMEPAFPKIGSGGVSETDLPIVMLVNGYSASASEITAGCFQDNHLATLVGEKTFGKGCAQEVLPLPQGAGCKITVEYFLTPDGHRVQNRGIEPNVRVAMPLRPLGRQIKDVQLQKAIQILRSSLAASAKATVH